MKQQKIFSMRNFTDWYVCTTFHLQSHYFSGKNYITEKKNYITESILRESQTGAFISIVYLMNEHNYS